MSRFKTEMEEKNIELLFQGYWYNELPPILELNKYKEALLEIVRGIENGKYNSFKLNETKEICEFKETTSPEYIYNDGIEAITFFDFKRNGSLREMQVPNLKYYCSFVYNTMMQYSAIFEELYINPDNRKYIKHSNSNIMNGELFDINHNYDEYEEILAGVFMVNNDKKTSQFSFVRNSIRYMEMQETALYSIKIDLESFYPNIYTHYLSKCKDFEPMSRLQNVSAYFEFLDYYNMKINSNQTKGIAAGVFSSVISSELMLLCIDKEIDEVLGNKVKYIRYVDDITFFSDSLEEIKAKLPLVQRILNKYRLRINQHKTEEKSCLDKTEISILMIYRKLSFLCESNVELEEEIFLQITNYIAELYNKAEYSKIKTVLTLIRKKIEENQLYIHTDNVGKTVVFFAYYLIQLAFSNPIFTSRTYRLLCILLDKLEEKFNLEDDSEYDSNSEEYYNDIMRAIMNKTSFVNDTYNETILQVWHYYLISKYGKNKEFYMHVTDFQKYNISPIIVALFVKDGNDKNGDIFKYIKKEYMNQTEIVDNNAWQVTVMYSKWWLPLLMIYIKDGKDYSKFYESNNFNQLYKDIKL